MHIIYPILRNWHYNIIFKNILIFLLLDPIVERNKLCQMPSFVFAGPG